MQGYNPLINATRPLLGLLILPFAFLLTTPVSGQTITTIAGNGGSGFSGDNGPALNAQLNGPFSCAVDAAGNVYIADSGNNRIRKISNGVITTVAGSGNGTQGYSGDGGPATSAMLSDPLAVAVDSAGNLYIADTGNSSIRKVSNGVITTVAGNGTPGFEIDNTPATGAVLLAPFGVAVDAAGNLYIADAALSKVLKVSNGVITTVAGNGTPGFSGDNGPATSAELYAPWGIAVDSAVNLYIADFLNDTVRKVSNGVITTVAGSSGSFGFTGDNGPATSAELYGPSGVAVDAAGNLYIADSLNSRIRKVANGIISTVAGNGNYGFSGDNGPAIDATLGAPQGLAVSSAGNIFIADTGNNLIREVPGSTAPGALTITTTSLPNGTVGQPYGPFALTATGGSGSYTWTVTAGTLPAGLSLSASGVLSGTPTVASSSPVTVSVTSGGVTVSAMLPLAIAQAAPLQIPGGGGGSQVTLAGGMVGIPYSQTLPAVNGAPPYSWSLLGGALPNGLSLSKSGTLSGVPAQAGGALFTARVTDSSGTSASSAFVITIAPQSLTITTKSPLPNGIVGVAYPAQILSAKGGSAPYTFQISGALPGGLVLSGGAISGIPTASGTFNFSVTATDSSSPALIATAQLQITVQPAQTNLILSQASVAFSLYTGASGVPAGANVSVRSSAPSQQLTYSISVTPAAPWLDVTGGGTTPGTIGINLDPKALALGAGTSQTSIVVTCGSPNVAGVAASPCSGSSQTINVSLTVTTAPPQLSVGTSLLSCTAQTSNTQTLSQSLGLQNAGGGSITVISVTTAASFATIGGVPATIPSGPPVPVTVTVNPAGLAPDYYQSTIAVNTSAGSVNVPLTLFVAQNATMNLSPAGTEFESSAGSTPGDPNGSFQVSVAGSTTFNWTATLLPGASWLTLNTTSGTSTAANPGVVNFTVNSSAASLAPQAYYAQIQVASGSVANSPQTFVVVLSVAPATSPVLPDPEPEGLLFISGGATPPPQTVQVFASSTTSVTYQASSDSSWLVVSPASGSTSTASPGSSSVSANLTGLASGVYRGNVSYALSSALIQTVNVTLIVNPGAVTSADRPRAPCVATQLVPTQTGLVNNFSQPTAWPTPLAITLVNDCGQPVTNAQVVATFSNGDPPLALSATNSTSGIYSGTWTPRNAAGQVTIAARATAAGFLAATAQITGQVTPNAAPLLTQNGTLNAFAISAEPGVPVAPGTIVQIYGSDLASQTSQASTIPLPNGLNQTSVIIGGLTAPLYFVSAGQINAQVPFELTSGQTYQVIVSANGALSTPNPIQLAADAPGICQTYTGEVIAQHTADYSLISETSPAKPGEVIVIYVSGMGLTNQTVLSGTASPSANPGVPLDTPTLTVNGIPVTNILFAGLTPTLVGLYQIDFQLPANAPNGDLQLVLTQTSGVSNSAILPVHN